MIYIYDMYFCIYGTFMSIHIESMYVFLCDIFRTRAGHQLFMAWKSQTFPRRDMYVCLYVRKYAQGVGMHKR